MTEVKSDLKKEKGETIKRENRKEHRNRKTTVQTERGKK